jgi:uncharacterized protein (TIGR04255 family)
LKVSFQNQFDVEGKLSDVQLNQAFKLEDESHLQVSVSSGKTNKLNEPLLIWQIGIQKLKIFEKTELFKWLNRSHDIASDLFKKIVKPDLYDSFT